MPRSKKTYESLQDNKAHVVPIGKEQTFDYFFRQYYAALCFFAQSIIHNEEDAKDIVQDCFVKLWNDAIALTEKNDTVKSFLYTMVHNRSVNYLKKKTVITKAQSYLQTAEENFEYFDELAFAEMMRRILADIEKLPANMSTILKKYYLQKKKYKDIAEELSSTPDAVRMQKVRAIKLLKQRLILFISVLLIFF